MEDRRKMVIKYRRINGIEKGVGSYTHAFFVCAAEKQANNGGRG